jgi:sucrose-6-phosphate hydrolase SacC (GH32 family)
MKLLTILFTCILYLSVNAQSPKLGDTVRQIAILKGQTYLNLPVTETNKLTRAKISVDGKVIDQFTIKLATANPDYWVFFDVTPYQGKTLTFEISTANISGGGAFANITQTNNLVKKEPNEDPIKGLKMVFADVKFPGQDSLYKEKLRPQVHFSSKRGWINDPNGLLFYGGQYHMFYQHNPYGWAWGNMHWGHAVSNDLVKWEQLTEAIYPFGERDAAFSGSAVYDPKNTSGFRKNGVDPLIAVYTSTGRGECLKMSYDNGKTFIDYEGNPILKHRGRDPRVFWYEPGNHWVMVVWDQERTKKMSNGQDAIINQHLIYNSPDLKNWTYQSGVAGFFECPDLFSLPIEGKSGKDKWVMYDATGRYIIGDFDGKKFTIDQHLKKYDYGGGFFYAAQTFNNVSSNRRIQVGWGRGVTQPNMPFNQAMFFPTELKLKNTFDGLRLCPTPISEISTLHYNSKNFENKLIKYNEPLNVTVEEGPVHVIVEIEKGDATQFGLNILGYEIEYNDLLGVISTNAKTKSSFEYIKPDTEIFKIEAIVDNNIIEVFINDGEMYYAAPFDIEKTKKIEVYVKGRGGDRKAIVKKMDVHQLKSIWDNR